jgi:hypothetical protein
MTAATEIVRRDPSSFGAPRPAAVSQATAIEQSRAIAEVQAAVVVAQSCPRSMTDAEAEMEYVCGRLDMAEQAFYQVTNRGTGPSVHLARELARIWGNIDYGVKELHRSDEKGESEVLAFSWDIQKNSRSSRTFIVPHQRMKQGKRVDLTDLQDIYLNNQNVGARAVRETIFTILPRWYTEKAQNLCRATLEHGEGEPLQDRITKVITWFADNLGVTVAQLEARAGKARGQWDAGDIAQFAIARTSIQRGEVKQDELFPPLEAMTSTADEIAKPDPEGDPDKPAEQRSRKSRAKAEEPAGPVVPEPAANEDPAPATESAEATHVTPPQETGAGDGDTKKVETAVEEKTTAAPDAGPPKSGTRKALEKRLFVLLGESEVKERDDRIAIYRAILHRPEIQSTNDLDDSSVAAVGDQLYRWQQANILDQEITEILNAAVLAAENQEQQS